MSNRLANLYAQYHAAHASNKADTAWDIAQVISALEDESIGHAEAAGPCRKAPIISIWPDTKANGRRPFINS